ncbi:MAG: carbohydrate-binding domain-containing protein [Paramuribaculum sp.]|nr:carbohydrate-binding domain-containing protein [Paramuribaculum sp.]
MITRYNILLLTASVVSSLYLSSCSKDDPGNEPDYPDEPGIELPGESSGEDDSDAPEFSPVIEPWNGEKATDAGNDKIDKNNPDIYHEAGTFNEKVYVIYNGSSATVTGGSGQVKYVTEGAYVTIDMLTNSTKEVEIIASGNSDDGQLKIYGEKKFKLTLDGLELTSRKGPAINNQCKKRVFVHVSDGTVNKLTDCATYTTEPYYHTPTGERDEDRKGCFFSEGNLIFSGSGILEVAGKYRHGIATDGYMWMRPGVTIVVSEAAKNAVQVKGNVNDGIGFNMAGGLLYTNVSSLAGKGINTDLNVVVAGGKLILNQSGDATYDESEQDTSSPSGIKADGNVIISDGTLIIKSTGLGGKGINSKGPILISGGETTVTTSGATYIKSQTLTSSPKGIKADGNIEIKGGVLNIAVTGSTDDFGSLNALESKLALTIDGGIIYTYATDDAISATSGININGGKIYAHSTHNDAIDSNGYLNINGGLIIANGASGEEEAISCKTSSRFMVNGGTIIGTGGTCIHTPSPASKQKVVIYNSISVAKNDNISILSSAGMPTNTYTLPRGMNGMVLFYSSSDLKPNETYYISKNGELTGYTDSWRGWYYGGTWAGGEQIGTFTPDETITIVGNDTDDTTTPEDTPEE